MTEYRCIIDCPRHCTLTDPYEIKNKDFVGCVRFPRFKEHIVYACEEAELPKSLTKAYNDMFMLAVDTDRFSNEHRGEMYLGDDMGDNAYFEALGVARSLNILRRAIYEASEESSERYNEKLMKELKRWTKR